MLLGAVVWLCLLLIGNVAADCGINDMDASQYFSLPVWEELSLPFELNSLATSQSKSRGEICSGSYKANDLYPVQCVGNSTTNANWEETTEVDEYATAYLYVNNVNEHIELRYKNDQSQWALVDTTAAASCLVDWTHVDTDITSLLGADLVGQYGEREFVDLTAVDDAYALTADDCQNPFDDHIEVYSNRRVLTAGSCPFGYEGADCSEKTLCTVNSDGKACQNGGAITGFIADNNCACQCVTNAGGKALYDGPECQNAIACANDDIVCHNSGTVDTNSFLKDGCKCNCNAGYSGDDCSSKDSCLTDKNGDTCVNGVPRDFIADGDCFGEENVCICDFGYTGDLCDTEEDCITCDTCAPDCAHGGVVAAGFVLDGCQCNCSGTDYEGALCNTPKQCTTNSAGGACQNGGSATGLVKDNNCACECQEGYEGDACEIKTKCASGDGKELNCGTNGNATGFLVDSDCACECECGYIFDASESPQCVAVTQCCNNAASNYEAYAACEIPDCAGDPHAVPGSCDTCKEGYMKDTSDDICKAICTDVNRVGNGTAIDCGACKNDMDNDDTCDEEDQCSSVTCQCYGNDCTESHLQCFDLGATYQCRDTANTTDCGGNGFTGAKCDVCAAGSGWNGLSGADADCVACNASLLEYNTQTTHDAKCQEHSCPESEGVVADTTAFDTSKSDNDICELCAYGKTSNAGDGSCAQVDCPTGQHWKLEAEFPTNLAYTDASDKSSWCANRQDPVLAAASDTTVEAHKTNAYTDDSAPACTDYTDAANGNVATASQLEVSITLSGTVNRTVVGVYTLTYECTDAAGASVTASRTVTVQDTTDPSLVLSGGDTTVTQNGTFTAPDATCDDSFDVSPTITSDETNVLSNAGGSVSASTGTYTITYTCKDASGNTNTKTHSVTVECATNFSPNSDGICVETPTCPENKVEVDGECVCDVTNNWVGSTVCAPVVVAGTTLKQGTGWTAPEGVVDLSSFTSVTIIDGYMFNNDIDITSVIFPSSLEVIGDRAFNNCEKIAGTLDLSHTELTTIGMEAFYGAGVENIIFPTTLKTIKEKAFSTSSLKTINLTGTQVTTIEKNAFKGTYPSIITLPSTLVYVKDYALYTYSDVELDFSLVAQDVDFQTDAFWTPKITTVKVQKSTGSSILNGLRLPTEPNEATIITVDCDAGSESNGNGGCTCKSYETQNTAGECVCNDDMDNDDTCDEDDQCSSVTCQCYGVGCTSTHLQCFDLGATYQCRDAANTTDCGGNGFTGATCSVCAAGSGWNGLSGANAECLACNASLLEYNTQTTHDAKCQEHSCPKSQGVVADTTAFDTSKSDNNICEVCAYGKTSNAGDGSCAQVDCPTGQHWKLEAEFPTNLTYTDASDKSLWCANRQDPVLVGVTNIRVEAHKTNTYTDTAPTCTDYTDAANGNVATESQLAVSLETSGTVNRTVVGVYTLTYVCTDAAGASITASRTITVQDTIDPSLVLLGGDTTVTQNETFTAPNSTCDDSFDVSPTITSDETNVLSNAGGSVSASTGTYTITYTCEDASGNTDTKTHSVTVECEADKTAYSDGICIDTPSCGDNQSIDDDGVCVCDEGFTTDGNGICYCNTVTHDKLTNGSCVDKCPDGLDRIDDNCVVTCEPGYILNATDQCELTCQDETREGFNTTLECGSCKPGYSDVGGICTNLCQDELRVGYNNAVDCGACKNDMDNDGICDEEDQCSSVTCQCYGVGCTSTHLQCFDLGATYQCRDAANTTDCAGNRFSGATCSVCAAGSGWNGLSGEDAECLACNASLLKYNNQTSHDAQCQQHSCPAGEGFTTDSVAFDATTSNDGYCTTCKHGTTSPDNDAVCAQVDCPTGQHWKEGADFPRNLAYTDGSDTSLWCANRQIPVLAAASNIIVEAHKNNAYIDAAPDCSDYTDSGDGNVASVADMEVTVITSISRLAKTSVFDVIGAAIDFSDYTATFDDANVVEAGGIEMCEGDSLSVTRSTGFSGHPFRIVEGDSTWTDATNNNSLVLDDNTGIVSGMSEGVYTYICTSHSAMIGKITVLPLTHAKCQADKANMLRDLGIYTATYTCTDAAGATATKSRTITVQDRVFPAFDLNASPSSDYKVKDNGSGDSTFVAYASACTDDNGFNAAYSYSMSDGLSTLDDFETATAGTYIITHKCTDDNNNQKTYTQSVTVDCEKDMDNDNTCDFQDVCASKTCEHSSIFTCFDTGAAPADYQCKINSADAACSDTGFTGQLCNVCAAGSGWNQKSDASIACEACVFPETSHQTGATDICTTQKCAAGYGVVTSGGDSTGDHTDLDHSSNCEVCPYNKTSPEGDGNCAEVVCPDGYKRKLEIDWVNNVLYDSSNSAHVIATWCTDVINCGNDDGCANGAVCTEVVGLNADGYGYTCATGTRGFSGYLNNECDDPKEQYDPTSGSPTDTICVPKCDSGAWKHTGNTVADHVCRARANADGKPLQAEITKIKSKYDTVTSEAGRKERKQKLREYVKDLRSDEEETRLKNVAKPYEALQDYALELAVEDIPKTATKNKFDNLPGGSKLKMTVGFEGDSNIVVAVQERKIKSNPRVVQRVVLATPTSSAVLGILDKEDNVKETVKFTGKGVDSGYDIYCHDGTNFATIPITKSEDEDVECPIARGEPVERTFDVHSLEETTTACMDPDAENYLATATYHDQAMCCELIGCTKEQLSDAYTQFTVGSGCDAAIGDHTNDEAANCQTSQCEDYLTQIEDYYYGEGVCSAH